MNLRALALEIALEAVRRMDPREGVLRALEGRRFPGEVVLLSLGKAGWTMAAAAREALGSAISRGLVVTKYGHSRGPLEGLEIIEAGHPLPDANSLRAGEKGLGLVENLSSEDTVLLLVSGGGSALFELPWEGIALEDLESLTEQLLRGGADIREINTLRKRLSQVKGGRLAERAFPARVLSLLLSDVVGDAPDAIASGPGVPDVTTREEAREIGIRYNLSLSAEAGRALNRETPKELPHVAWQLIGGVSLLCQEAAEESRRRGFTPWILTTSLDCEAREAGAFFASLARTIRQGKSSFTPPCALIAGGETVVHLRGNGKGGRNQELALAGAFGLEGVPGAVLLSLGSDGTDGPTDAAGGLADWGTLERIRSQGTKSPRNYLEENDAYHALALAGDHIVTGPTGTNVNDLVLLLME
jgi:hydroxypyruvate reductase